MTALAIALVLVAALAWDAYRRTLALRRVDELKELRASLMGKASTGHVEALEADLKRLRTDVELGGIGKRR